MTPDESAWWGAVLAALRRSGPRESANDADEALAQLRKRREAGAFGPPSDLETASAEVRRLECVVVERATAIHRAERERDDQRTRAEAAEKDRDEWKMAAQHRQNLLDVEERAHAETMVKTGKAESLLKEALGAPGDPDFILWTANRFVNVYKESPHVAHVGALRQRAGVVLAVLAKAKAAGYVP